MPSRIAQELPQRRWAPENHRKLVDFVAEHGDGAGPAFGLFDADHTTWTGDVGDSTLVYLLKNLGLSPRLHTVLPEAIEVPAEGFGVRGGRLFPAARVRAALEAMTAAAPELIRTFTEAMVLPGGPLHGNAAFTGAYRVYTGTVLATYALLEAEIGCLAFGSTSRGERVVTPLFERAVCDVYARSADLASFTRRGPDGQVDVIFPPVLDTGPDQPALRAQGKLGSYSQITIWEALDKTPAEMERLGLEVWEASAVEASFDVVFPVDPPGASSPAPLDFAAAHPAEGVALGTASMVQGVRLRPEMVDLMGTMARHGIVPVVVTASHADLVRAVLGRWYGLAGHPVVGMLPVLEGGRYGADLTAPAPYRPGKVDAAREVARLVTGREETRPALCAGDTNTDLEMLAYSGDYRLFFDRGKRPLMDLAEHLVATGAEGRTLIQRPFA